MGKKMQVVGGKALLSTGRGSHLLPCSCCSLFVVLSSPVRSRSRREGGQSTLQLLGTCLGPLCPGQEGWLGLSRRVLGTRSLTRGSAGTALAGAAGGSGSGCSLAGAVNGTPRLDTQTTNLSPVLLLFCSLCLTNSLGFSWFLFQLLPSFCCCSTFPVPPLACCSLLPGPPVPPSLQPDTLPIQVALKVFCLAGCPA